MFHDGETYEIWFPIYAFVLNSLVVLTIQLF